MSKFWVIFKREYAQVVKKKSFIIGIFLTPAMMAAFMVLPAMLAQMKSSKTEKLAVIDQSGYDIGSKFSVALDEYKLDDDQTPYYKVEEIFHIDSTDTAHFAVINDSLSRLINAKELKYFLVIRAGAHLADSNIYLVTNSDNFRSIARFEKRVSDIVSSIRLQMSNVNLTVDSVLSLTERVDIHIRDAKGESIPFQIKFFSALIFVGIMYGMIFGYGQLVMRSVIEEKNSRIMEVLISSVSPFQLMLGKVMGLGAATFTQVVVWFILGTGLYIMRGTFNIDPSIDRILFNPAIICFFILYMISGYILFSTFFALIGSIVNSEKEAQNFIFPIVMVMILPFMLGIHVIQEPNSTLSVTLSFIPFLTPTMMLMRVIFIAPTLTEYSLFSGIVGEASLAFILVVLSTLGMIWLTAKIFRVGVLMYGKRPTLPEIVKWIKY
ncbi:MAG: ABC transporter permease [Candidatus Zixiibacteriota bacterium]|nr:MAG: ABC transporter permease [candidate division Zixibacteria bacterium]